MNADTAGAPLRRIFVTDCEGPVTKNDNAQEIAERFLPNGAEFFARLSRYDDLLADVVHRPGYNAGDTLRLLPPFLKAFEVTDGDVELFSAEGVLLVPGALEALDKARSRMPAFIISTSYTPYLKALCALSGFPMDQVRCTELSLDTWDMPEEEKWWLRSQVTAVMGHDVIDIPEGALAVTDLSLADQEAVAGLDDLFWRQMDGRVGGAMLAAVRPVGGSAKLAALEAIMTSRQISGSDVMYVGDSITDVPPLESVRRWAGASLSFNGNAYALAAAEFAAASPDAAVIAELAEAFADGGRDAVERAVRAWPRPKKGVAPTGRERAFVGVVGEELEALAEASAALRRSVRGERVARLG
jgi:energy-converting hydrogenase A subunit R